MRGRFHRLVNTRSIMFSFFAKLLLQMLSLPAREQLRN
jgi:hypothetical protein